VSIATKICGVQEPEHAAHASRAGADMVGVVLYPKSKRSVSLETALKIRDALTGSCAGLVLVFVNQPLGDILEFCTACRPEYVQLAGNESARECVQVAKMLDLPVIKSIHGFLAQGTPSEPWFLDAAGRYPKEDVALLCVDAPVHGAWGGTGVSWEYKGASVLSRSRRILLAGGLTSSNVGSAIRAVRPWGVDVSSGVETSGRKDISKVSDFLRAVRDSEALIERDARSDDS